MPVVPAAQEAEAGESLEAQVFQAAMSTALQPVQQNESHVSKEKRKEQQIWLFRDDRFKYDLSCLEFSLFKDYLYKHYS